MKENNYNDQEFLPEGRKCPSLDCTSWDEDWTDEIPYPRISDFFDYDKKIKFLEQIGYKIIDRVSNDGIDYCVAIKDKNDCLPEDDNIDEVFDEEAQDCILNIFLKYGRK